MTGIEIILGAVAGAAIGVAITALRWAIVRRVDPPPRVPASADVLDAERHPPTTLSPLTDRRTR